jgi:Flp pilus assembly secretin CpaC
MYQSSLTRPTSPRLRAHCLGAIALLAASWMVATVSAGAEREDIVRLRVGRSILLHTKVDVYRTAIVDNTVCDIVQTTPREISIVARAVGQTHVTFWFDDPGMVPLTYLFEVQPQ